MFGGFDGEFFNDLNIIDIEQVKRGFSQYHIEASSKEQDYMSMVDSKDGHDIIFKLISKDDSPKQMFDFSTLPKVSCRFQEIYANKSLLLFRTIEKEIPLS